jgi:hypothetical protein
MMRVTALGTPGQVQTRLAEIAEQTGADELMLAPAAPSRPDRIRAVELTEAPAAVKL